MRPVVPLLILCCLLVSCKSASQQAHEQADAVMYKPVEYTNAAVAGPQLVVLPGGVKSSSADFTQKVSENNLADFAEIELAKANFTVLERTDLGALLKEIEVAVGLGDPQMLKSFRRGRFQATRWFVRFDIVKADPVAEVKKGFDGTALGILTGAVVGGLTDNKALGTATGAAVASTKTAETSNIWLVGLRYKILDAVTGVQVATGYFEEKLEVRSESKAFLGVSETKGGGQGLDSKVQQLVQKAVAEIDGQYKLAPPATAAPDTVAEAPGQPEAQSSDAEKTEPVPAKEKHGRAVKAAVHSAPAAQQEDVASASPTPTEAARIETDASGGVRMDEATYARIKADALSSSSQESSKP